MSYQGNAAAQAKQSERIDVLYLPDSAVGGGGGRGRGVGPGDGPGVGPGSGGDSGDGPVGRGPGVKDPVVLHEVKPTYTPEAIRAKLQGVVALDVTVMPDGSVNPRTITVIRSLDRQFGLDEQAVAAAKQWKFAPAVNLATGERVPFRVTIEMTFTLR
jgi:protein TonB